MNGSQDIQSSLAEIDQKLRELRERLAGVFEPPEGASRASGSAAAEPIRPEPRPDASRPEAEDLPPAGARAEPAPAPAPSEPPGDQAIPPPPPPPPPPPAAEPRSAPPRIVSVLELAAAQVDDLQRHIQSLQRVHDELRELIGLPGGEPGTGQGGGLGTKAVPPPPSPGWSAPTPPPAPPPGGGASGTSRLRPDQQGRFEDWVTVNAGPFADMWTLGVFERALANLPDVEDVSIRSFEGTRALMDVRLSGAVDLVAEMRRAIPFTVGVVELGDRVLVIDVGAPSSSSRRSAPSATGIARGR